MRAKLTILAILMVSVPAWAEPPWETLFQRSYSVTPVGVDRVVIATTGGVMLMDVTDLAAPRRMGLALLADSASALAVRGDLVLVAHGPPGLSVVSLASPGERLAVIGSLDLPGASQDLVVNQKLAYVAVGSLGMEVVDISDPAHPRALGRLAVKDTCRGLDMRPSGQLILADGVQGVVVVDVSDPASPREVGRAALPGEARKVHALGDRILVACGAKGVVILGEGLRVEGTVDSLDMTHGLDVEGNILAMADGTAGLALVDISQPHAPLLLSRHVTQGAANSVVLFQQKAYVAADARGMEVLDIADPTHPRLLFPREEN